MRNRDGFTLIELMAVVLILGIMLGAAIPSLNNMVQNNQLRSEARRLTSFLRNLQQEAITTEETTSIRFNHLGAYYLVAVGSLAEKRYDLGEYITYSISPATTETINFNSIGALVYSDGIPIQETTIEFRDTDNRKVQVVLKPSGRVSIITP